MLNDMEALGRLLRLRRAVPLLFDRDVEGMQAALDRAIAGIDHPVSKVVWDLVWEAITVDGAHHKQHYLLEIARAIGMDGDTLAARYGRGVPP